jgi:hypothetical protein
VVQRTHICSRRAHRGIELEVAESTGHEVHPGPVDEPNSRREVHDVAFDLRPQLVGRGRVVDLEPAPGFESRSSRHLPAVLAPTGRRARTEASVGRVGAVFGGISAVVTPVTQALAVSKKRRRDKPPA